MGAGITTAIEWRQIESAVAGAIRVLFVVFLRQPHVRIEINREAFYSLLCTGDCDLVKRASG
jgi:hypothetical protein